MLKQYNNSKEERRHVFVFRIWHTSKCNWNRQIPLKTTFRGVLVTCCWTTLVLHVGSEFVELQNSTMLNHFCKLNNTEKSECICLFVHKITRNSTKCSKRNTISHTWNINLYIRCLREVPVPHMTKAIRI